MTKISIAIPTYNRKEYLRDAIKSILRQTHRDFILYIFDNASDYDIQGFLSEFNDERIKLIRSERNLGNLSNFERIFSYEFGTEYLVVFHDDDTMSPDFLRFNAEQLDCCPNAVFVGSRMNFVSNPSRMSSHEYKERVPQAKKLPDQCSFVKLLLSDFDLCFDSVMYRTRYLTHDLDVFTKKYSKWFDRPYLVHLSAKGPILVSSARLLNYRVHSNQDSQSPTQDGEEELLALYVLYKEIIMREPRYAGLYFTYSTNTLLLAGFSFAQNLHQYIQFIRLARSRGLFKFQYLNIKGAWYVLSHTKKFVLWTWRSFAPTYD